jgi:hypothetical protein
LTNHEEDSAKHLQIISSWTPKRKRFNWWENSTCFLKRVESNHDKLGLCHTSYGYGVQIHSSRTNQKGNPDRERRRDTVPPCRAGHEPAGQRERHARRPAGPAAGKGSCAAPMAHAMHPGPCPCAVSIPAKKQAGGRTAPAGRRSCKKGMTVTDCQAKVRPQPCALSDSF